MAHDIVADHLLAGAGIFIINVFRMCLQFRDLLVRDWKTEFLFDLSQCDPQLPPGTEFHVL